MELKEYQVRALDAFTRWREALAAARQESETAVAALEQAGVEVSDDARNYPKKAWKNLADSGGVAESSRSYVHRTAAAGYPIPHVCFKVPTGGGKTLLAAAALERLNQATGLVLWIVPTRAIYQQTKDALWNREHPYRQMLMRASGGRVNLLEKDDSFTAADNANYLCVMLLMLPAANRQKGKEFLRMFRDSGRYPSLFPDSDDLLGDGRLLSEYPDLERNAGNGTVKHSLFNVFKTLRPVVVLDEAHKAYGRQKEANEEFVRSVNRLNPSLVIELSATPNRSVSNLLVDISGVDLKNEEMIKLPVRVTSFREAEWQYTLGQAHDELERLETEARSLEQSTGRYIRPIAVVRVERTGKDQRDGERVHAEDAREYLIQNLGAPADSVRVKSADNDELGREDLLSDFSPVRWIITKAALMEGWDCPFASLLVMLDNTRAQRAITQLVGRVMRQPHARRTEREALDQCYVYCWNTDVGAAVEQVKRGLEQEGLTGLDDDVWSASETLKEVLVQRREPFRGRDIYLPRVLHEDGDGWCELDYERHILPLIDWGSIKAHDPQYSLPDSAKKETASVDVGDTQPVHYGYGSEELHIDKTVKLSYFTRRLTDVVPNPWQAAHIVEELLQKLHESGESEEETFDRRLYLAFALREHVTKEVEKLAECVFRHKLSTQEIRFDLEAGDNYRMCERYAIPIAEDDTTLQRYGKPIQLSLFDSVYDRHFDSTLERNFAFFLDEQKALTWWHRIAAGQKRGYYLRGWKRERIYPDFVALASKKTYEDPHLLVFETKGEHLRGNPDTEYKRRVLKALQGAFNVGRMRIRDGPAQGTFKLIFSEDEFPTALANVDSA